MNRKRFIAGIVLALIGLVAWIQFSDRETSARIAPKLESTAAGEVLVKTQLESASSVLGREPEAGAATEHVEVEPHLKPHLENVTTVDGVTRLHGFVHDEGGVPIEGVMVYLRTDAEEVVKCQSASDGAWALETTEQGERLVTSYKPRYAALEVVLSVGPEIPDVRHDLVLHGLQILRVDVVLPDGTPALPALRAAGVNLLQWNLMPLATKTHPGARYDWRNYGHYDRVASGSYMSPGVGGNPHAGPETLGFLTLYDPAPLFVSLLGSNQVFGTELIDAEANEVAFTVSPVDFARLEGRVTARIVAAEDGSPLLCTAAICSSPFMYSGSASSSDGQLDLGGLVPGSQYLVVQSEGRAEIVQAVEVLPGDTQSLGEVRMFKPVTIRGRIVTSEEPLPTAQIHYGRYDSGTKRTLWIRGPGASSNSDGSFELSGLAPGIWAIRAPGLKARPPKPHDPRLVSATILVDASLGSVEEIELTLFVSTRVTLVTGKTDRETIWRVRAHDSHGVFAGGVPVGLYGTEIDLHLPPGNFDLELFRDGELIERRAVAVGSDSQRIDWPLE